MVFSRQRAEYLENRVLAILALDYLGKPIWAWLLFCGLVAVLLAFDLGVLHRKAREIRVGESLLLSAGYTAIALVFGAWVWIAMGQESGAAYLTGFFIEKTLALDNVFVISLIFSTLAIPPQRQHRVAHSGDPRGRPAVRDRAGQRARA